MNPPYHSYGATSPAVLPDELIPEILSRLPVKTLMQMNCVCKSWKSLISNRFFSKLHFHRSPRNTHLALIPYCNRPDQDMDISVIPFPLSRLLDNPSISIANPEHRLGRLDCREMVGSCNGLICLLSLSDKYERTFRFWNPATKKISEKLGLFCNDSSDFFRFAFGYDNLTDTYKVVAFSANQVKVFGLGDSVWRNIESFPFVPFDVESTQPHCHPFVNEGVYVSGTINWLAIRNVIDYKWKDINIEQFVIVSLDLGTETYRQLLPPRGFDEVPSVEPAVTVLMDCLCFSHHFKGTHFVLWKMMEFGVQESWIQFLKISYVDLRIYHGVSESFEYHSQLFLFPLGLSESNDTLVLASNQESFACEEEKAILYNWRDNRVERTRFTDEILWFFTKGYVESLASPC
ncbi:F-box/kelch-repeat protein At3g23880-like [Vicia villosa]|uniref:F-box/kelch-repeat protein At3g23880-like n=1 Tax=Vicia villosa TaxID=3911 RepID=UPI00273ADCC7|nr:F-box/kelch-repeat protein At3g23880-like [Vicia villosa]